MASSETEEDDFYSGDQDLGLKTATLGEKLECVIRKETAFITKKSRPIQSINKSIFKEFEIRVYEATGEKIPNFVKLIANL